MLLPPVVNLWAVASAKRPRNRFNAVMQHYHYPLAIHRNARHKWVLENPWGEFRIYNDNWFNHDRALEELVRYTGPQI